MVILMLPQPSQTEVLHTSGKRFAVALASLSLSSVGILSSLFIVGAGFAQDGTSGLLSFVPCLAWAALGVMTVRWLQDRRCHWLWPVAGIATGVPSAVLFVIVFPTYVAAIPLAIYLVYWHLWGAAAVKVG